MTLKQTISRIQFKTGIIIHSLSYSKLIWKVTDKSAFSVLDVGCGKGSSIVKQLRGNSRGKYIVGFDIFPDYIRECKFGKLYDECVLADVRHLPIRSASFDNVFCLEVIEHLSRIEGEELLTSLEKISKVQLVLSLPVGFMYQGSCDGNDNHVHKSEWVPNDFKKKNYRVCGLIGPFFIKNKCVFSSVDKYLLSIAELVAFFLQPLFYFFPNVALKMICVKRVSAD